MPPSCRSVAGEASTMNGGSSKNTSGFYELIPEDGSVVDLTQPGLFSYRQLVAIFRRRGFECLLSTIHPDTNSLIRAYYDHIIPLPCRSRTKPSIHPPVNQKAAQIQRLSSPTATMSRNLDHECQVVSPATRRLGRESEPPPASQNREKRQKDDLDKLIIISNPNWPTSGVTPTPQNPSTTPDAIKSRHHGKRSPTSSPPSVSSPPPLKRPKINRNFANLEPLKCNGEQLT